MCWTRVAFFGRALSALLLVGLGVHGGVASAQPGQNNLNFNFNNTTGLKGEWTPSTTGSTPGWRFNTDPSNKGGGWQAFTGTSTGTSAAYLTSPCMILDNQDQQWLNVQVFHEFAFPVPNVLGQIQFRSGSNGIFGAWRGLPDSAFVDQNGNQVSQNEYLPQTSPPASLVTPLGPLINMEGAEMVMAFSGTSPNFTGSGAHELTEFTLFYSAFNLQKGDEFELRFVMANDQAMNDPDALAWEVNKVLFDGVKLCVVPEPASLALAAAGGLGCFVAFRRRAPGRNDRSANGASAPGDPPDNRG